MWYIRYLCSRFHYPEISPRPLYHIQLDLVLSFLILYKNYCIIFIENKKGYVISMLNFIDPPWYSDDGNGFNMFMLEQCGELDTNDNNEEEEAE